jgi:hypothetical protein
MSSDSKNDHTSKLSCLCNLMTAKVDIFHIGLFVLFVLFLLAILLSVLLQLTDSDYPFGIFKLFLVYIYYTLRADHC